VHLKNFAQPQRFKTVTMINWSAKVPIIITFHSYFPQEEQRYFKPQNVKMDNLVPILALEWSHLCLVKKRRQFSP